jgi:hypothetical protein
MDNTVKKTIAVVLSAVIIGIATYGSYLPLRKSQMFIDTLQGLQTTPPTSLQDLETRIAAPLDYPSPIGQEELVRNTANNILGLVQQTKDASTTIEIIQFLQSYYDPIIAQGKGMSFGQDLYLEGAINEIAFSNTGDPDFLIAAQKYYAEGQMLGPNRPQTLYGLFDVYRALGDVTDTIAVANQILTNWPTDTTVGPALQQFLAAASSTKGK